MPWQVMGKLIDRTYLEGEVGRPAFPLATMLRLHLLQKWFGYRRGSTSVTAMRASGRWRGARFNWFHYFPGISVDCAKATV